MAILAIVSGLICSWLVFVFFRYVTTWAMGQFGFDLSVGTGRVIGLLGFIALFSSGYSIWKKGGGLTSFGESSLYAETLASSSAGGAYVVNRKLSQVTGTSHALSQLFLAGPLMLFNAATRFSSLIPLNDDLEKRMSEVLEILRKANKWQGVEEYPGKEEEISSLIKVGAANFGVPKGVPKIKVNARYGS